MPNRTEILATLRRRLPVCPEAPSRTGGAEDLVLRLRATGRTRRLVCAVRSVGEPRYLAQAITALTLAVRRDPGRYPVVVAPYIAPEGQRLCLAAGVGFLDLRSTPRVNPHDGHDRSDGLRLHLRRC